ncbi:ESSS subunit of NADH:ubiquinone oxidoreductase-domain-containing protein [Mycena amicta]|nr:ESSS subunit of NADH:ubiquinone oxidoreductase-domain-containing protein [Mycena amicta]
MSGTLSRHLALSPLTRLRNPPPPGHRRIKEPWENIWYWGMYGSMAVGAVLLYFKPDTSIQTWALKEAKRRMDERGEKYKYEPSSS